MITIIQKCEGCSRVQGTEHTSYINPKRTCSTYAYPKAKWEHTFGGSCPMADHVEKNIEMETKRINPIKASKRGV